MSGNLWWSFAATVAVSYRAECACNYPTGCHEGRRYTVHKSHPKRSRHSLRSRSAKQNGSNVKSIPQKLAASIETGMPESLTVVRLPEGLRKRLRTYKVRDRINQEIHRPFKVPGSFGNDASCRRVASEILMDISDVWQL